MIALYVISILIGRYYGAWSSSPACLTRPGKLIRGGASRPIRRGFQLWPYILGQHHVRLSLLSREGLFELNFLGMFYDKSTLVSHLYIPGSILHVSMN